MGTPIPDKSEAVSCALCWGPDTAFGPDAAPLQITVVVSGIEHTPAWVPARGIAPDGEFILSQNLINGCFYFFAGVGNSAVFVSFFGGSTLWSCASTTGSHCFDATNGFCEDEADNEGTPAFENGTMTIIF